MKKLLILVLISIFITGCLGYNELDNLMIINDIYISKSNNNFKFYLNEISASRSDVEVSKNYKEHVINCSNINSCFKKFDKFPKKVYLSHLKNIMLDYSFTNKELEDLIKNFNKVKELREDFFVVFIDHNNYSKKFNNSSLQMFLNHHEKSITFYDLKKSNKYSKNFSKRK